MAASLVDLWAEWMAENLDEKLVVTLVAWLVWTMVESKAAH